MNFFTINNECQNKKCLTPERIQQNTARRDMSMGKNIDLSKGVSFPIILSLFLDIEKGRRFKDKFPELKLRK